MVFIPGPRFARADRTNGGGGHQVVGGSEWVRRCGVGGIRDTCQGAVGLLCVVWLSRFFIVLGQQVSIDKTMYKTHFIHSFIKNVSVWDPTAHFNISK